ncbi:unnamed protein product [Brassicogethes aeneus]|uniref:HECT domain-containing protein n=1 Tax=Brassicogethes aeneus TaxID=1431903 RepID=A0A9P0B0R2_BRAAE|nr:unnamed protein product [Brassicogethes aeneus]
MTEETSVAQVLLRATCRASQPTVEERNFTSLLSETRQHFRRNSSGRSTRTSSPTSGRGRKRRTSFKKKVILIKLAHADFCPSNTELKFLRERGLGMADKDIEIYRTASIEEIMDDIVVLYPPNVQNLLMMCGFRIGRMDKSKRISCIVDVANGQELEEKLMQSKIIVLPNNDFPSDLPVIEQLAVSSPLSGYRGAAQSAINSGHQLRINEPAASSSTASNSRVLTGSASNLDLRSRPMHSMLSLIRRVSTEDVDEFDFDLEESKEYPTEENEFFVEFPDVPDDAEVCDIRISRGNCVHDLLKLYTDKDIINKKLNVRFEGEMGVDGGGLTKEMFNIFFNKCNGQFFRGEDSLIPFLELNNMGELDKFIIIGRILNHMLAITHSLPLKLSKLCLMLVAFPEKIIDDVLLLNELFLFVNPYLRKILKKATNNFTAVDQKEIEVIQDFYQSNKFYAQPSADRISQQLSIIAQDILVDRPKKLIAKIREGVLPENYPNFWNKCDFNVLSDMGTPTATKIANALITDQNLTNEENETLHFFTMYIHCLDREKISTLLFLITGSYVMTDAINVKFSNDVGLSQRPTFNTCSDLITLPKTYCSYDELKNDLNACLYNEEALEYTSY